MRLFLRLFLFGFFLTFPGASASAFQSAPSPATITSPLPGQALQGTITITGTTAVEGFQSAQLSFAYADNSTDTWFLIAESSQPVTGGVLAEWDTTTITDGSYDLRLTLYLSDGRQQSAIVPDLRVRNDTPEETSTPEPATPVPTQAQEVTLEPSTTADLTLTPAPPAEHEFPASPGIPTPLPPNPAEISGRDVLISLVKGVLAAVGLFALMGIYGTIYNTKERE